jgi:lipoyl(octanoyl) transferase
VNSKVNKKLEIQDWGLINYADATAKQEILFNKLLDLKVSNRNTNNTEITTNYLIFCEHPHVYTLGKSGHEENLLLNNQILQEKGVQYFKTTRGGDITYHGPGQLVVYPILDLENFFTDIHKYLRLLEQAIINTCALYNINAGRIEGLTGVWILNEVPRKICAMGVKCSRWISMHGLALNVNTLLEYFEYIIPCGISDKAVTSMQYELNKPLLLNEVANEFIKQFKILFEIEN